MKSIGVKVVVLPPFGDGNTEHTIQDLQYVAANGEFTQELSEAVAFQYILDDGFAYAEVHLELV